MDVACPHCERKIDVADKDHYRLVRCPGCGEEFQAFSDTTQKLSREFLDQILKKKEPES